MNKTELIAAVAEQSGLSKKDAEKAVSSTIDTIINTVAEGEKIQIAGFGTFEQRQRNARTGCDPRTGKCNRNSCFKGSCNSRQARALRM